MTSINSTVIHSMKTWSI